MIRPSWLPALFTLFLALPAQAAFTDNGDGTVTDTVTGLMWKRCSEGYTYSNNSTPADSADDTCTAVTTTTFIWSDALATAKNSSFASHNDWRLPNRNELESLVKIDAFNPAIDTTAFPNTVQNPYYWSSTNYMLVPANAWNVVFSSGNPSFHDKANSGAVRLVRSGQLFDSFDSQDITAPSYSSASINATNTIITLTFNEALVNHLADIAALKAAITFAADGTNYNALAGGDVVAISGSTVTVTFATPLTGSSNKVKIAASSLKDAVGNLVISDTITTALLAIDTIPDNFSFTAQTGAALSSVATSNTLTVSGINSASAISITNGEYQIGSGGWTSGAGTVNNGETVTVRQTSSGSYGTLTTATLSIGGVNGAFDVTTLAEDTIPDNFSFTAQTGAALSSVATSNTLTVAGINSAAAIGITNGEYQIGSGGWTSAAGTVNNGETVTVRQTASASYSTLTTATLTIGGVNGTFDVTTQAVPAVTSYTAPSATGTGSITVSFTGGGASCGYTVNQFIPLTGHAASPPAGSPPAGVSFPHGLFDFTTSGCTAGAAITMTITYPQALQAGTAYWKYGPTPGNAVPHWYQLPATIVGNTATFSIIDGGLGDDDLLDNGTIVDQGGPGGNNGAGAVGIPTLTEWALLALAGLMGLFGLGAMRRRAGVPLSVRG